MQARYPTSPGNPSPAEIFAAYKDIPAIPGGPNSPSGMQILQNIVNQHKNDGLPNGSIALSVLNAANQAKPTPPMPQGTIADQVMAQANPPMDPNMMGLATPGLEQFAQQQGMATGGLVALASGGPVQGYAEGQKVGLQIPGASWVGAGRSTPEQADWDTPSWTLQDLWAQYMSPEQTEADYYKTTAPSPSKQRQLLEERYADINEPGDVGFVGPIPGKAERAAEAVTKAEEPTPAKIPGAVPVTQSPGVPSADPTAANPTVVVDTGAEGIPAAKPPEERTMGGTSSKVPTLTAEQQIEQFAKLYEGDHAKAAELKGQMEKRLASKENKDLITDIATGLGMMFSGQGTKTQAMGQGLMAFAAQHAKSGEGQDRLQSAIDAMNLQEEAQQNAAMQAAIKQVYGTQAENAKLLKQHGYRLEEIGEQNKGKIAAATAKATGEKGLMRQVDYANIWQKAEDNAREKFGSRWLALPKPEKDRAIREAYNQALAAIPGGPQSFSGGAAQAAGPIRRVMYTPPTQ